MLGVVVAVMVVGAPIALGQADNCLPCSNCRELAQLESARCVGAWELEWRGSTADEET